MVDYQILLVAIHTVWFRTWLVTCWWVIDFRLFLQQRISGGLIFCFQRPFLRIAAPSVIVYCPIACRSRGYDIRGYHDRGTGFIRDKWLTELCNSNQMGYQKQWKMMMVVGWNGFPTCQDCHDCCYHFCRGPATSGLICGQPLD